MSQDVNETMADSQASRLPVIWQFHNTKIVGQLERFYITLKSLETSVGENKKWALDVSESEYCIKLEYWQMVGLVFLFSTIHWFVAWH